MADDPTVILLHGADEFAIHQYIHKLVVGMGDPSIADMNITLLDGHSLNMDALRTSCNAIPFLSARRLVILVNPVSVFKGISEHKKLFELVESLPPTTTLVLVENSYLPAETKGKKSEHWLQKWAKKSGTKVLVQPFSLPDRRDMPGWIVNETRKQAEANQTKIKIEPAAASLLAGMVGEDTRIASQEIAKLLEYVNFEHDLTAEDVRQVSIVSAQEDVFALVDAMGNKNGHEAQRVLHLLLENEDPFSLWGMVIRQFRLLLLVREVQENGGNQMDIEREIHVHPYVAQKLSNQAKGFNLAGLESIYHRLLTLDEGMKTGQVVTELALDMLVIELCE
jgi:DNA polymerase-3 subunit delta